MMSLKPLLLDHQHVAFSLTCEEEESVEFLLGLIPEGTAGETRWSSGQSL
jgi:hypothetical protein